GHPRGSPGNGREPSQREDRRGRLSYPRSFCVSRAIGDHLLGDTFMISTAKFTLALSLFAAMAWSLGLTNSVSAQQAVKVLHKTVKVGDLDIFYREAGPKDAPTILLLHGFPTSSQMFRNLIPALADRYHLVAPDYPGFGHSSMPSRGKFSYTF